MNKLSTIKTSVTVLLLLYKSLLIAQVDCGSAESPIHGSGLIGQDNTFIIWNSPDCSGSTGLFNSVILNRNFRFQQLSDEFDQVKLESSDDNENSVHYSSNKVDGIKLHMPGLEQDVFAVVNDKMAIRIGYVDNIVKLDSLWTTNDTTFQLPDAKLNPGISLCSGKFNADNRDELVVAYQKSTTSYLGIFEIGNDLYPILRKEIPVSTNLIRVGGITVNDFDRDNRDEIVILLCDGSNDRLYMQAIDIQDDFEPVPHDPQLVLETEIDNSFEFEDLTSGYFNNDGYPELAFAYSIVSPCNEGQSFGCEDVFLHMAKLSDDPATNGTDYMEKFEVKEEPDLKYFMISADAAEQPSIIDLESGDLNGDGKDEIILGAKEIHVISLNNDLFPVKDIKIKTLSEYGSSKIIRPVSLGDINGDKKIDLTTVNYNFGTVGVDSYFEVDFYSFNQSLEIDWHESTSFGHFNGECHRNYSIITGYFSNTTFRIDSCGIHKRREDISDPVIILNAPPVHFDVFDENIYDINNVFLQENDEYYVKYISSQENSTSNLVTTKTSGDWGFQPDFSLSGNASYKDKISGYFSFNLEDDESDSEEFFKGETTSESVSTKTSQSSRDDAVLALVSTYDTWEHNVYDKYDTKIGSIIAVKQSKPDLQWTESRSGLNKGLSLDHEVGNILSYPYFDDPQKNDPRIKYFIGKGGKTINLGIGMTNEVELTWNEMINSSETYRYFRAEKPAGFGLDILGLGIGVEDGSLAQEETISTVEHTLGTETKLMIMVGKVTNSERSYSIEPYFYWSKTGALVVDYVVDPDVATGTWWVSHYGQKPDPAFIMPFRLDTLKGIPSYMDKTLYQQTSSIFYSPAIPDDNDTITIYAKINNYSLISTGEAVPVSFYLNNPGSESNRIVGVNGEKIVYTTNPVAERNYSIVNLRWAIPDSIKDKNPKIYAVIDPEDEMDEIHEENNTGWSYLFKLRASEIPQIITNTERIHNNSLNFEVFPNPASGNVIIQYTIENESDVQIDLVRMDGRLVRTFHVINKQGPGNYSYEENIQDLLPGIYLFRITSNQGLTIKRLIKI